MKVIFLDIDGVLNSANYQKGLMMQGLPWQDEHGALFSPTCVNNLRYVIEETEARIVISSSWKRGPFGAELFSDMQNLWKDRNLLGEMIDVTPNLCLRDIPYRENYEYYSMLYIKGYEIDAWIKEYESWSHNLLDSYCIVDDEDVVLPRQKPYFVQTNPFIGISETDAEKMIEILNKKK